MRERKCVCVCVYVWGRWRERHTQTHARAHKQTDSHDRMRVCAGFAGVYFEKVLKGETAGVWVLNVQLAGMSVLIASCSLLFSHYERSALPPLLAMHCAAAV